MQQPAAGIWKRWSRCTLERVNAVCPRAWQGTEVDYPPFPPGGAEPVNAQAHESSPSALQTVEISVPLPAPSGISASAHKSLQVGTCWELLVLGLEIWLQLFIFFFSLFTWVRHGLQGTKSYQGRQLTLSPATWQGVRHLRPDTDTWE